MKARWGWIYTVMLMAVLVFQVVMLRRLDASEKSRRDARLEYRAFRESLATVIARNESKHKELTAELKLLKTEFADARTRLRIINKVIPVQAIEDRAHQK